MMMMINDDGDDDDDDDDDDDGATSALTKSFESLYRTATLFIHASVCGCASP